MKQDMVTVWFRGAGLGLLVMGWLGFGSEAGGTTWNVSTVSQLHNAVDSAGNADEIVVAAGTYNLQKTLVLDNAQLILRGATGNRDDVVLVGGGMNTDGGVKNVIHVNSDDITIRDLTVSECFWNGIQIRGEYDVDRTLISNVKTLNIGERHIKGSRGGSGIMDDVVIENLHMLQNKAKQPVPGHPVDENDYIGGIDAMGVNNWIIRDCVAKSISGVTGGGRGALFLWNGVNNLTAERNVIWRCDRGIAIGNPSGPTSSSTPPWHSSGGIIRNNFVFRGAYIALELCNTNNLKVYNNTIYSPDATYSRTLSIYDESGEGLTTNLDVAYNIIRGQIADNTVGGGWTPEALIAKGNIVDTAGTTVVSGWFVNAALGDFHLTPVALPAIDGAAVLVEVPEDIDRQARPVGADPDVGADEYVSPVALLPQQCEPPADGTLPKQRYNVIRLVFDGAIQLPGGAALEIVPIGGGADVGGQFTYSLATTNVAQDTLKAVENLAVLSNRTWYRIEPAAGFGVQAFVHDVCTLQGDADGSGQVLAQDYFPVKNHLFEVTEARYDLDGDGMVLAQDYFVTKNHLFDAKPPKP